MRLILASAPEGKEKFTRQIEKWTGKSRADISICMINEAISKSDDDCRWLLQAFSELAATFGGKLAFVNLRALDVAEITARLSAYDVIWCFGGYTQDLLESFVDTGFAEVLPEILKNKIWVGSSAGACVLAENYLGLLDFRISPHQKNQTIFKENTYFLTDSAGLIIDNNQFLLVNHAV